MYFQIGKYFERLFFVILIAIDIFNIIFPEVLILILIGFICSTIYTLVGKMIEFTVSFLRVAYCIAFIKLK